METRPSKNSFSMIVLDLDDTIIPTTIRQCLYNNFDIDIFELYKKDKLKGLQLNIIDCLQSIKHKLTKYSNNHTVEIALISNASMKWLKQMLVIGNNKNINKNEKHLSYKHKSVFFPILSKYFMDNNISIHCAKQENESLYKEATDNGNLWVLKYKSISSIIRQKENKLNIFCKQIISFGDGICEKKAVSVYSTASGTQSIHFELLKAPSIYQMNKQWRLIKNNIDIYNENNQLKTNRLIIKMNKLIINDNDKYCIGVDQIYSISQYFASWLDIINTQSNYRSKVKLNKVAEMINARKCVLATNKKYNGVRLITDVLCGYVQLQEALNNLAF